MDQIFSFFSHHHVSFGGIVDTHLSPKQMKFLSKRVCDYTSFHSDLDSTKHGRFSGGVSLFVHNSLAIHTGRTDVIVAKFAWNFSGKLRIIPVN
ncbi:hypothetical protein RIR_jg19903.t1 [Rhizophagus irregularis DAOM 181602=DAOM 197198]|uniref:Uncharacterized protein n=1 Tax=Rhizophagus irregularis (strain DAOM 197198w) TaxID=1432141 RepID=A0A015MFY8_RHIIW|nr:hypothetical protein RirG_130860 [Rhizophagus irregularis DAOM 197198w]GBC23261.1 hypothetical protein RIR_jg19903.t1 [Rhizophagus irregularis DAOM 181602=DAOM 197198]